MATQTTTSRQIKALQNLTRGEWVKFQGSYYTNAFEAIYAQSDDCLTVSTLDRYEVVVTKIDGAWFIGAEEHHLDDLVLSGVQPKEGFATLREAKAAAEAFGEHYEQCWKECEGID